jgi:hypothetical protein
LLSDVLDWRLLSNLPKSQSEGNEEKWCNHRRSVKSSFTTGVLIAGLHS